MLTRTYISGGSESVGNNNNTSVITFLIIFLSIMLIIYLLSKCSYQNIEKFTNNLNKIFM